MGCLVDQMGRDLPGILEASARAREQIQPPWAIS